MDKLDECYGEETGRAFTQRKKLFLEYETETHTFSDMVYFKKAFDTGLMSRNRDREEERMNQKRRERKKERKKERRKERKKERKKKRKKEKKKEEFSI